MHTDTYISMHICINQYSVQAGCDTRSIILYGICQLLVYLPFHGLLYQG